MGKQDDAKLNYVDKIGVGLFISFLTPAKDKGDRCLAIGAVFFESYHAERINNIISIKTGKGNVPLHFSWHF